MTYSEGVFVALAIKHSKRTRFNILSSVACPVLQHFPLLSHEKPDFRGKNY